MEMRSWKWQERDAWFQQVLQVCLSLDIKCMSCMFVPLQELDNFILLLYNNVLVTWSWSQKQESKGCVVRYIWIVMLVSNLLSYTTLCLGYNLLTHKPTCIVVPKGNHDVGRFGWRKLTFTNIDEERQERQCSRITSRYKHQWHRKTRRHHDRQKEEQRLIKQLSLLKIIYVSKECFNHCLMFKQK